MSVLTLNHVGYKYEGMKKTVLRDVNATFDPGRVYSIVGKSGAGKSTLLSLISGLDVCTSGEILKDGKDLKSIDRDDYRAQEIGVIFQSYNLLTNATALENIVLSMQISKVPMKNKKTYVYSLLERMGIDEETADRQVLKLSGGEQQRVGIARALSHNPDVLIADEPTGNLDRETAQDIMNVFLSLAHDDGKCVIIVTHSRKISLVSDVTYGITEGRLTVSTSR